MAKWFFLHIEQNVWCCPLFNEKRLLFCLEFMIFYLHWCIHHSFVFHQIELIVFFPHKLIECSSSINFKQKTFKKNDSIKNFSVWSSNRETEPKSSLLCFETIDDAKCQFFFLIPDQISKQPFVNLTKCSFSTFQFSCKKRRRTNNRCCLIALS